MWRRKRSAEPTYPTSLQQSWTDRVDRQGSVEFFRSRRKLVPLGLVAVAFVVIGVLMLVTASSAHDRVISALVTLLFGCALAGIVAMWFQRSPILKVDRTGLHLPRRTPLEITWGQVVRIGTYKVNRMAATQLRIRIWPDVFQDYVRRMPSWQGRLFRFNQRTQWRDCLAIQLLDVPEAELAAWLDEQTDRRATPPSEMVLLPVVDVSPLWGVRSERPFDLDRLGLPSELRARLEEFATRAAPVAEQVADGGSPGPVWGLLAAEGRQLCADVGLQLNAGATVVWFEDEVLEPV
jgi:hypothetical protein